MKMMHRYSVRRKGKYRRYSRPRLIRKHMTHASFEDPTIMAVITARQPSNSYPDGLAAIADTLVLQMFDSSLGEALQIAYTTLQEHQEHQSRRAQLAAATDGLRDYLARLDEHGK